MGKLLNAVQNRYYRAKEYRDAPMPDHTHGGTTPSEYYNTRRDMEFGLKETAARLQRQLSRMSSGQLDQIYLNIIDNDAMSKLPLVDFQNKAANPASDGSWLMRDPFQEESILKLASAMEEVLPPETADAFAAEVEDIKPMNHPDYPKEEKYDYPVQSEIQNLKNALPPEQRTEENLKLLDEVNEETREVSEKYFDFIKSVGKGHLPVKNSPLSGMENYGEHVMYAYVDGYFKSDEGRKYAKELEVAKSSSTYYHSTYDWTKVDSKNTPEFMKRLPELRELESGASEETVRDVTSVVDDMNSLGPGAYDYNGMQHKKYGAPWAESGNKNYGLAPIADAKEELQKAVRTGDMEKIRQAHEKYKTVKATTDRMMETARTKPEQGQSDVFESNLDALRGNQTSVPDEYLMDFAGHSKLAGTLLLNNYARNIGVSVEEIVRKPVPTALKATDDFIRRNGINSGKNVGAKLANALSVEQAQTIKLGFTSTTGGAIQRAVETVAGFAHSREEAQRIVGQSALAQAATNGIMEAHKEKWLNLAESGLDKQHRLYELAILMPEDQVDMADLAEKFDKKNWRSELSTDKLLQDTVGKGGFDYEALIQKADRIKAEADAEVERLDDLDSISTKYTGKNFDVATVTAFRKVLEAAPRQDRSTPGYLKLQAETEKRTLALDPVKKAETKLDRQIEILGREKTGWFVNKENSAEHQQMMKSLKDLQDKKRLLRGETEGISPEQQEKLRKISLDQAIRNARNDTMAYSRKVEEDGKKTTFRYQSGADRANAATHAIEALDEMADTVDARTMAQRMEDKLQRNTMDNRKDAEQVQDNAARTLYLSFIQNNPEKFTPEMQEVVLSNKKMQEAMEIIEKDAAFQKMVKSMTPDQLADKVIEGPDAVLSSYLDAQKALQPEAVSKSGSEMTREERQEFMKNATFGENRKPGGPEV